MKIAIEFETQIPEEKSQQKIQFLLLLLHGFIEKASLDQFFLLTLNNNNDFFHDLKPLGIKQLSLESYQYYKKIPLFINIINWLKINRKLFAYPRQLRKKGVSLLFSPVSLPYFTEPGIPTLSILHDLMDFGHPAYYLDPIEISRRQNKINLLKKNCDFIICFSSFVRDHLVDHFAIEPERVISIPKCIKPSTVNLPDILEDEILNRLALLGKKYLIYPASIAPEKNHQMLLVAFNIFRRKYTKYNLQLVLMGVDIKGHLILEDAVKKMGLSREVHFLNELQQEEITAIWRNAYALIFPSLFESFGTPLVDAMIYGKPILASNTTSIPEVAGDAALYFNPRKPDEIVDTLHKLFVNDVLYKELSAKGRKRLALFDFNQMIDQYINVFNMIVKLGSFKK